MDVPQAGDDGVLAEPAQRSDVVQAAVRVARPVQRQRSGARRHECKGCRAQSPARSGGSSPGALQKLGPLAEESQCSERRQYQVDAAIDREREVPELEQGEHGRPAQPETDQRSDGLVAGGAEPARDQTAHAVQQRPDDGPSGKH